MHILATGRDFLTPFKEVGKLVKFPELQLGKVGVRATSDD